MRWWRRSIIVLGALALIAAGAANAGSERANRHAAQRDAARLLKRAVLPADAIPSATEPAGDDHFLSRPGQVPALVNLLDRHGWWTVPGDETDVSAFVRAHRPKGTRAGTEGVRDGQFPTDPLTFELPPVGHVLGGRVLARATQIIAPGAPHGSCEPMTLTIKGHRRSRCSVARRWSGPPSASSASGCLAVDCSVAR
jgi:hypothetical protein